MLKQKEFIILDAYENKWIATFNSKREAVAEYKRLCEQETDGGEYCLYEAKEI